jgi:protein-S-isoprenylcysteine O-methyltransferase Ste14
MLEPASCRFVKPIRRGGSEYSWAGAGLEHETWVWPERTSRFILMIPPLVYLAGIVIGFLATIWMPTKVVPDLVARTVGGILILCGAVLTGSAILKFKDVGTTVGPDRAASTLVIGGPYNTTRNPMYLGLAFVYLGVAVAGQSVWALILLPVIWAIIQRRAIEPEEAFLEKRFGANYISYKEKVRRWL